MVTYEIEGSGSVTATEELVEDYYEKIDDPSVTLTLVEYYSLSDSEKENYVKKSRPISDDRSLTRFVCTPNTGKTLVSVTRTTKSGIMTYDAVNKEWDESKLYVMTRTKKYNTAATKTFREIASATLADDGSKLVMATSNVLFTFSV